MIVTAQIITLTLNIDICGDPKSSQRKKKRITRMVQEIKIKWMTHYKESLENELKGVTERLKELKKEMDGQRYNMNQQYFSNLGKLYKVRLIVYVKK